MLKGGELWASSAWPREHTKDEVLEQAWTLRNSFHLLTWLKIIVLPFPLITIYKYSLWACNDFPLSRNWPTSVQASEAGSSARCPSSQQASGIKFHIPLLRSRNWVQLQPETTLILQGFLTASRKINWLLYYGFNTHELKLHYMYVLVYIAKVRLYNNGYLYIRQYKNKGGQINFNCPFWP